MKIKQVADEESLKHLAEIVLSAFEPPEKRVISLDNSLDLSQPVGHLPCGKWTDGDDGTTNN